MGSLAHVSVARPAYLCIVPSLGLVVEYKNRIPVHIRACAVVSIQIQLQLLVYWLSKMTVRIGRAHRGMYRRPT